MTCNVFGGTLNLYLSIYLSICQFHLNRTASGKVMTLNLFLKMAAVESEIYFRVQVKWWHSFKKVNIYLHTECPSMFYYNPRLTTSGFGKRTPSLSPKRNFMYFSSFVQNRTAAHDSQQGDWLASTVCEHLSCRARMDAALAHDPPWIVASLTCKRLGDIFRHERTLCWQLLSNEYSM